MRAAHNFLSGVVCLFAFATVAAEYPHLSGTLLTELQFDYVHAADVGADQGSTSYVHDLFTDSELALQFALTPHWTVKSGVKLEPVRGLTRDRSFDDHALYVEQGCRRCRGGNPLGGAGDHCPLS